MQEMPPRRSVQSLYASQEEPEASVQPPKPRRRSRRPPSRTQPTTPPAVEEPVAVEEPAAAMEHADAGGVLLHLRGRGDCRGIHFLWCVDGVLAWSRKAPVSTNT